MKSVSQKDAFLSSLPYLLKKRIIDYFASFVLSKPSGQILTQKYRAAVALTICCCLSGMRNLFRNNDCNSNGNVPQINKFENIRFSE